MAATAAQINGMIDRAIRALERGTTVQLSMGDAYLEGIRNLSETKLDIFLVLTPNSDESVVTLVEQHVRSKGYRISSSRPVPSSDKRWAIHAVKP